MTLYRNAAAALIAALIIALSLAARAELVAVKPYDPENPGYLMPAHLYAEAALLVDRRGGFVSSEEAIGVLWEDEPASPVVLARYRKVALRLKNLLEEYGISGIVESVSGKRRIVPEEVECDLFEYLSGRELTDYPFCGSYLSNYSWAEVTLGELTNGV